VVPPLGEPFGLAALLARPVGAVDGGRNRRETGIVGTFGGRGEHP
jgi:hypothetical protein